MTFRLTPFLTLDNLADGLDEWNGRYEAIDVFADDVAEMQGTEPLGGLTRLPDERPRFEFRRGTRGYHVVLFEDAGVLRLEYPRPELLTRLGQAASTGAAGTGAGALAATLANATGQKGSAAQLGLLLGLVVGSAEAGANGSGPRRVFALEFHAGRREWLAYDGGLIRWMREKLLPA